MQMTAHLSTRRKAKSASANQPHAQPISYVRLTHEEEMALLRRQAAIINRTPESALAFLKRAGLVTPSGRWRRLIRD
jgi:hypothetical protein